MFIPEKYKNELKNNERFKNYEKNIYFDVTFYDFFDGFPKKIENEEIHAYVSKIVEYIKIYVKEQNDKKVSITLNDKMSTSKLIEDDVFFYLNEYFKQNPNILLINEYYL